MNLVAIKMLVGDRMKYIALVLGIAFASLLITQQASIFTGYARQTSIWIHESAAADLWVMDEQVEHTRDLKPMQDTMLNRVRGVGGVQWAVPMNMFSANIILPDGTRKNARFIGIDDATLIGAPPEMVEGKLEDLRADRAVLMNADMADGPLMLSRLAGTERPLCVGDRLSADDNELVITGSYRASKEFFWEPIFYTTFSRAKFIDKERRKQLNYVMVKIAPGVELRDVQRQIDAIPGIKALSNDEFANATMWWILNETGILINFGITILLGVVIGLLVSGQTLYTFVLDNLRNFGA